MIELLYPFQTEHWRTQAFGNFWSPSVYPSTDGYHNGVDYSANDGDILVAPIDGVVKQFIDYPSGNISSGYGVNVEIWGTGEWDDYYVILAHGRLDGWLQPEGAVVTAGTPVLKADNTGFSTGSHLHFGLRPKRSTLWTGPMKGWLDPEPLLVRELTQPIEEKPVEEDYRIKVRTGTWNWADLPNQSPGTPVGLLAYTHGPTPGHNCMAIARHAAWLADNGLEPLVRFDYRPGQTCPRTEAELAGFLVKLEQVFAEERPFASHVVQGKIKVSAFNEPNNPAEGGFRATWVARCFNGYNRHYLGKPEDNFCAKMHSSRCGGPLCSIWAPAPNCYGSQDKNGETLLGGWPLPEYLEQSPWVSWAYSFWKYIKEADVPERWPDQYTGYLLHAYGRLAGLDEPSWEPYEDVLSAQGWQFGSNILQAWANVLYDVDRYAPVYISECNTLIDWKMETETQPADNYPKGWLGHFRDYAARMFADRLEAILWFTGSAEGVWHKTALQSDEGRMPLVREEYLGINVMERTE